MNYPIGRAIAISKLSDMQLKELHDRENARQFLFPAFNVRTLFPKAGIPDYMVFNDVERSRISTILWESAPNFKHHEYKDPKTNVVERYTPSEMDLDFMHEWDVKIFHSDVIRRIEGISSDRSTSKGRKIMQRLNGGDYPENERADYA